MSPVRSLLALLDRTVSFFVGDRRSADRVAEARRETERRLYSTNGL